jgi:hypothetical protein
MSGELVVFLEGKTEIETITKLNNLKIIHFKNYVEYKSSRELNEKLYEYLDPLAGESINMIILRDLDAGKSRENLIQGTEDVLKKVFRKIPVKFVKHNQYPNIYLCIPDNAEIKIVLHIAQRCSIDGLPPFKNCTTDDYVLDLALRTETIVNLKEFKQIQKENPQVTPEEIQRKVISEISDLLGKNGIQLSEAKSFVNMYILVLQLDGARMRYADLPGKVIKHAEKEDIKEVFESWIAAFNVFTEEFNEP